MNVLPDLKRPPKYTFSEWQSNWSKKLTPEKIFPPPFTKYFFYFLLAWYITLYKNDWRLSARRWILFIIILIGWHFLGQAEVSCLPISATQCHIHCTSTHCPLVCIINPCSSTCGLSIASTIWLVFSPKYGNSKEYDQNWPLGKAKHNQEANTVCKSPFINIHPPTMVLALGRYVVRAHKHVIVPKTNIMIWGQRLSSWLM